jgi:hypothetical protein
MPPSGDTPGSGKFTANLFKNCISPIYEEKWGSPTSPTISLNWADYNTDAVNTQVNPSPHSNEEYAGWWWGTRWDRERGKGGD